VPPARVVDADCLQPSDFEGISRSACQNSSVRTKAVLVIWRSARQKRFCYRRPIVMTHHRRGTLPVLTGLSHQGSLGPKLPQQSPPQPSPVLYLDHVVGRLVELFDARMRAATA